MKKIALALVIVCLFASMAFAAKVIEWKSISLATLEVGTKPSSGVYSLVGAKNITLTALNCTACAFAVDSYLSNGTTKLASTALTSGTAAALKSPYFKVVMTAVGLTVEGGNAIIYITDN